MQTFSAEVIQFLRPSGLGVIVKTELPEDVESLYYDMRAHDCRLEAEVLSTLEVSVTVTSEDEDVDISLTGNGPEVQEGIIKMLKRQMWRKPRQTEDAE